MKNRASSSAFLSYDDTSEDDRLHITPKVSQEVRISGDWKTRYRALQQQCDTLQKNNVELRNSVQ